MRKKVKGQSKNIMSGKIPANADRYRADGCVGRRQLTEALALMFQNIKMIAGTMIEVLKVEVNHVRMI